MCNEAKRLDDREAGELVHLLAKYAEDCRDNAGESLETVAGYTVRAVVQDILTTVGQRHIHRGTVATTDALAGSFGGLLAEGPAAEGRPAPIATFRRSPSSERAAWHLVETLGRPDRLVSLTFEGDRIDAYAADGAFSRPELLAIADACHVVEEACELVYPQRVEWVASGDGACLVDGSDYSPSMRRMDGYDDLYRSTPVQAWDADSAAYEEVFDRLTDAWQGPADESLGWEDGCLWLRAPGDDGAEPPTIACRSCRDRLGGCWDCSEGGGDPERQA